MLTIPGLLFLPTKAAVRDFFFFLGLLYSLSFDVLHLVPEADIRRVTVLLIVWILTRSSVLSSKNIGNILGNFHLSLSAPHSSKKMGIGVKLQMGYLFIIY